ncbi:MAG: hypothetical protein HY717_13275 [Planctomycetes bacterium]|nr:hypothetical protein [Planctomycetota bacterium]
MTTLLSSAGSSPIPEDFPRFYVPGHEGEMDSLRSMFWLHYPGAGPKATLWDEWLSGPSLWPAARLLKARRLKIGLMAPLPGFAGPKPPARASSATAPRPEGDGNKMRLLLAFVLAGAAIEVSAAGDLLDNGSFERGLRNKKSKIKVFEPILVFLFSAFRISSCPISFVFRKMRRFN